MAQRMPIIVSAPLAAFEEMWLGAGEVDLKLKVNVQQFVAAYKKAEAAAPPSATSSADERGPT